MTEHRDPPFLCDTPGCAAYACRGEGWSGRKGRRGRWWCGACHAAMQEDRRRRADAARREGV